ncbi:MAG TPA: tetratricopeptide repeat protein, partial [Planctomycetaceae bacterium]|nr:tetratricopeptide repeat protein [Planctomycetaceae bacterium]
FDSEISVDIRRCLAAELSEQMYPSSYDYVLDIVLCEPLPETADLEGAVDASTGTAKVNDLVMTIVLAQARVKTAYATWVAISRDPLLRQCDQRAFLGELLQMGVFRKLAVVITCKDDLSSLQAELSYCSSFTTNFPTGPRIIAKWFELLRPQLGLSQERKKRLVQDSEPTIVETHSRKVSVKLPQYDNKHAAYTSAAALVDSIARHFAEKHDSHANTLLNQLIAENLSSDGGQALAVKSLCNVASKVAVRGRDDVSDRCLQRALQYPDGIDSVYYRKIANQLRNLGKISEALECYDKAEQLCAGNPSELDEIVLAKIHIHAQRGEYGVALGEYRKVNAYRFNPRVLTSIGDLYRKSGELRLATRSYTDAIRLDGEMHRAAAGLAQVWKQKGEYHRAIGAYNELFRKFPKLGGEAAFVYRLSRSQLFRITQQYGRAERDLLDLYELAPHRADLNLQLATLYEVMGRGEISKGYRERVVNSPCDEARLSILMSVVSYVRSGEVLTMDSAVGIRDRLYLPEDAGLVCCVEAYSRIVAGEAASALNAFDMVQFVDRPTEDLSKVLYLHASVASGRDRCELADSRIGALAKRGEREWREAIECIRNGRLRDAAVLEGRILLQVA